MLLFVHLFQVAKNMTTFESMRNMDQVNPLMSAVAAGTMTLDGAQLGEAGAGPNPAGHHPGHKHKKKEGCLTRWSQTLGLDAFIIIAFQGYKGSKNKKHKHKHTKRTNPFTRGLFRNCQDFWLDGPVFGRKESNKGLLNGQSVDYANMYDVPKGGMQYRGGYEELASADVEDV